MMKKWLFGILMVLAITTMCHAAYPVKPYTFTNNTVADATQVNANYDALYNGFSTGLNDINVLTLKIGSAEVINNSRVASLVTVNTTTLNATNEVITGTATIAAASITALGVGNLALTGTATIAALNVTGTFAATSITFGTGDALSVYKTGTFEPTVTLVGGAGNVVPIYTTNSGRYTRIGNKCFVTIYLNGDGGAEGAGTGTIHIALPAAIGASSVIGLFPIGFIFDNTLYYMALADLTAGESVVGVYFHRGSLDAAVSLTGADQGNTSRSIRLNFFYETN